MSIPDRYRLTATLGHRLGRVELNNCVNVFKHMALKEAMAPGSGGGKRIDSIHGGSLPGLHRKRTYIGVAASLRSVAATDVTSVYQTDVTSAAPTDTLCLCSNVSVGPADIKSVWATDVTSVASGRRYRGGL
ncbi:hypothetical protein PCASD_26698 [Puccinia coronata f. sp. avenae]|uniref:Uncharacterized protein n=1 Tax=Puccinia coronata f. sp. avenae TaxID=200324 RepID=A0A2N5TH15_9BASI|nr:hypothetical protein PCASD_26698 [Puccinia coronata f. sp. avenae]